MNHYISSHLSFQTSCMTLGTAQSSAHCKDFPSPVSFRVVPEKGCNAAAVHFWVGPAQCAEPSVNQALVFSSSVNQSQAPCACSATDVIVTGVKTIGIQATSSCSLLVPSGLAWTKACIYHLHLIVDCFCEHLTLSQWFIKHPARDGQLRSHGNLVAHYETFSFH